MDRGPLSNQAVDLYAELVLIELVGGPHDGGMVKASTAAPELELAIPIGVEIQLRPHDIHAYIDPDTPHAYYRLITEPRFDTGARLIYRYVA